MIREWRTLFACLTGNHTSGLLVKPPCTAVAIIRLIAAASCGYCCSLTSGRSAAAGCWLIADAWKRFWSIPFSRGRTCRCGRLRTPCYRNDFASCDSPPLLGAWCGHTTSGWRLLSAHLSRERTMSYWILSLPPWCRSPVFYRSNQFGSRCPSLPYLTARLHKTATRWRPNGASATTLNVSWIFSRFWLGPSLVRRLSWFLHSDCNT